MEYTKLISVTGLGGLYELIASKADGAIVRSLDDKSTRFVSSRVHNFSHLESIEVYTAGDNVNLADVFQVMEKSNEPLPAEKDANAIRKYFEKVYPDMDFERVYASDMRKMVRWFDVLKKNNVEIKLTEEEEAANQEESSPEENNAAAISTEIGTDEEKEKKIETEVPAAALKKEAAPATNETATAKKKITKK
jgi:hypothetical protein